MKKRSIDALQELVLNGQNKEEEKDLQKFLARNAELQQKEIIQGKAN